MPDRLSFGRTAGARYPLVVVAGGVGVATRHLPNSARSCELALRAEGAARGRPGGGAPLAWLWGVRVWGALPRPTARPRGVRPGPATQWLTVRGVWAWVPAKERQEGTGHQSTQTPPLGTKQHRQPTTQHSRARQATGGQSKHKQHRKTTAEHNSTAARDSTAPQNTTQASRAPQRTTPATGNQTTRPDRDTDTETHSQQTTTDRQTQHRTPEPREKFIVVSALCFCISCCLLLV